MDAAKQQKQQQQHCRQRPQDMLQSDHHVTANKRTRTSLNVMENEMGIMPSFGGDDGQSTSAEDPNSLLYGIPPPSQSNHDDDDDDIIQDKNEAESKDPTTTISTSLSTPSSNNDGDNDDNDDDNDVTDNFSNDIRNERVSTTQDAASKLQDILGNVKNTTQKLLAEIDSYLKSVETVQIDYLKCRESQSSEARRLEEVEPDVAGATGRFVSMIQQQQQLQGAGGGGAEMLMGMMAQIGGGV